MFGCYSSPLGGGIRTGLAARNEFTGPDLPETISLCGLHTFRVATRPPWASAHHTQLLEMANEIQNTFYRTHAFYLLLFIPYSFLSFSSVSLFLLYVSVRFLILVLCFHSLTFSSHHAQLQEVGNEKEITFYRTHAVLFISFWSLSLSLSVSLTPVSLFLSLTLSLPLWTEALTLFPWPKGLIGRIEG